MKRILALLIAAIGIVAVSVGCSSADTQVLEDKISQLEQQLNSQNTSSNTSSSQTSSANSSASTTQEQNNANTSTSVQNNTTTQQQTTNNQTSTNFDLTDITQKVNNVVQIADSTQPGANYSENISIYGQVKMQIEQVDFELDQLDNQIEYASRSGALSWDQYRSLDYELDALDSRLDIAKDSLELRLRIDD